LNAARTTLFLGLIAIAAVADAQAPGPTSPEPARLGDILIQAGTAEYPGELAATGAHGEALVQVAVAADGTLSDASLKESTGSAELDASALRIVSGQKLRVKEGFKPQVMLVPVVFTRDSVTTLAAKTCAEFNQDHAFHTAAGRSADDMIVFDMATGILVAARGFDMGMIGRLKDARAKTIDGCEKKPKARFLELYAKYAR